MGSRLAGLSLVHSITSAFSESYRCISGRFWCTTSMSRATALSSLVDFDLLPRTEVVWPSFASQPFTHYCRICKDNVMQLMSCRICKDNVMQLMSELVRTLDHEVCPRMTRVCQSLQQFIRFHPQSEKNSLKFSQGFLWTGWELLRRVREVLLPTEECLMPSDALVWRMPLTWQILRRMQ